MKVTEQYLRGTAYHEAGHAVVAWALGLPVMTICVKIGDAGGGTEVGFADHLSLIEQVAVCSAGSAAEEVFECSAHELASFNDHVTVLKLIEANGVSKQNTVQRSETKAIIALAPIWKPTRARSSSWRLGSSNVAVLMLPSFCV